jgi:hypothetical protein
LAAPAIGWWMQKLAGGATLTLDVFDTAGSIYAAAIVVAAILTLLLKETGSVFGRRFDSIQGEAQRTAQ